MGVRFGTSQVEACKLLKINLKAVCWGWDKCIVDGASASPFSSYSLVFDEHDHLVEVVAIFPAERYDFMRGVFVKKYGEPHDERIENIRNKLGAEFLNQITTWTGEAVTVEVRRYAGDIDTGSATFVTLAHLAHLRAEDEARKKKAAEAFR
jgi:hypothetical protein